MLAIAVAAFHWPHLVHFDRLLMPIKILNVPVLCAHYCIDRAIALHTQMTLRYSTRERKKHLKQGFFLN